VCVCVCARKYFEVNQCVSNRDTFLTRLRHLSSKRLLANCSSGLKYRQFASTKQRLSGVRLPVGCKWLTLRQPGERLPESRCFVEANWRYFRPLDQFANKRLRPSCSQGFRVKLIQYKPYKMHNTNRIKCITKHRLQRRHVSNVATVSCSQGFRVQLVNKMVTLGRMLLAKLNHSKRMTTRQLRFSLTQPRYLFYRASAFNI